MCGVTAETPAAEQYPGLWLQCDECLSWLHGACVGYLKRAPKGAPPPPPLPAFPPPLANNENLLLTVAGTQLSTPTGQSGSEQTFLHCHVPCHLFSVP